MPSDLIAHLHAQDHSEAARRKPFCRTFIQFLFSNLGLIILVIGYCVGGAFLFQLLEQYIELQNCQQGSLSENISVTNISQSMYNYVTIENGKGNNKVNISTMYDEMVGYLNNFTTDVYARRTNLRYTGQDCLTTSSWNFPAALLFTLTVITSIGYGFITPVSWEGQITCICYALIGIPIFLLCLSNMSSVLGDIFRFMYSGLLHCCCCVCRVYTRARRRHVRRLRAAKMKNPMGIDYTGTTSIDPTWPEENPSGDGKLNDDDDEDENEDDMWDRIEDHVPFGAVILIIIAYICMGAFMFNRFEGWTMIESVYFCYITLSTIGFGDYVPGVTSGGTSGLRFLLTCLYILFGLAILAMCFDLIKEGIVDKFRWCATKLGVVVDDEDQVDEDHTRYANFEYDTSTQQNHRKSQTQQIENSGKRLHGKRESNDSFNEPPAYDYEAGDGKWLKNIRDKPEPTKNVGNRKAIKH